jgi:large subunit ribosomal protein L18
MSKSLHLYKRRRERNRASLKSKSSRLRLSVFRSSKNIYAQIIDDSRNETLVSACSLNFREKLSNIEVADKVGRELADKAKKCGIVEVVFDRGAYLFHGRIKSLAEGARAGGLNF